MRDEDDQPINGERRADVPLSEASVDCSEEPTTTLLADYEQALGTAVDVLCGVIARRPTTTAADLRELLNAHPSLGGVTLAELFFESAANTE